jgi:hypothetical protein
LSNEKNHYQAILQYLQRQIQSVSSAQGFNHLAILGGTDVALANGIKKVCKDHQLYYEEIRNYVEGLGVLQIDGFLLVINKITRRFEVVVCEIKDKTALGLAEYSQLMGYCLSSYCRYGLLINVDTGASRHLSELLSLDGDLCKVNRMLSDGTVMDHSFGIFTWNSITQHLDTLNLGGIKSLSKMALEIVDAVR